MAAGNEPSSYVPPILWGVPFVALLAAIAVGPLVPACQRFWGRNRNKLIVSLVLSAPVLLYYALAHPAMTVGANSRAVELAAGLPVLGHVLWEAIAETFIPFIVLLFGLYTISGGIRLTGDLPAHPATNTAFLAAGCLLANLIGTTGAAMLLIRPLLQTNAERKHVRHTIVFFIFLVCNIGACLLPVGPPLFLGCLLGVPFLWTLRLAGPWLFCCTVLLGVYFVWDRLALRKETPRDLAREETEVQPLRLAGTWNLVYLLGVVLAAALLSPGGPLPLWPTVTVCPFVREGTILAMTALSLLSTPKDIRRANRFSYGPIAEVAVLFVGIFLTMQAPIEILRCRGASLDMTRPWQFFWGSGVLSSLLDNAPTYMVFFEAAHSVTGHGGAGVLALSGGQFIRADLLAAVSLGATLMGGVTYIGNGPNFMAKAIAEGHGVKMPGFFGYLLYSIAVLGPLFVLVTFLFL